MKLIKIFTLLLATLFIYSQCSLDEPVAPSAIQGSGIPLLINEFMASNDFAVADPDDDGSGDASVYDDWIEIYNAGTKAINMAGMYVTDDPQDLTLWQVPDTDPAKTTILPGGFLVIWADGEMDQGVLHADFKLSGGGEDIVIVDSDGQTIIDSFTYEPQQTDISYGRNPDGGTTWTVFGVASPGMSNAGASTNVEPVISDIVISPEEKTETSIITISAKAEDTNDNLASFVINYGPEGAMDNVKNMLKSVSSYEVELGPFADKSVVYFYLTATDDSGLVAISDTLSFNIGDVYIPPTLYINEFMASNDSSVVDPDDTDGDPFEDWIEIYNPGTKAVDIGGMYVTDDLSDLTLWQIPTTDPTKTTIAPGGFLVLWADKEMEQGILHVDIKLSGSGEDIGLVGIDGMTIIDGLTYTEQPADTSYARVPDGSNTWQHIPGGTPGVSNQ
ncbi:MAG: lamin tail domain-containing protein [Deferribacteres bacterium]|nr:lamin tail domain-containing protein [candidate division KSB1 bacterium]MCB9504164.1 lamin tail domain-containing protein [Deferribacteres bacterium]